MAKDLAEQLSRIGHKAELLVTRYESLKDENQALRERVQELEARLISCNRTIERQSVEIEHFKISSAIAPDAATAREARTILAELVREIDACVADLIKDV
ncbi:MAG: hypothetical protein K2L28_00115 [Muribaculaceae bacterium]|nr:hypothetical protein [Muribaculaceae bacterium]